MLLAKEVWETKNAVANEIAAPGARSWTICAIPRPSSAASVLTNESSTTSTGVPLPQGLPGPGRSPLSTSWAASVGASVQLSNESERIPTFSPLPSTPKSSRAGAASSWLSPSEITEPQVAAVTGARASEALRSPGTAESERNWPGRAASETVW